MNLPRLNPRDKIRIGGQVFGPLRSLEEFEKILAELTQTKRHLDYTLLLICALVIALVVRG